MAPSHTTLSLKGWVATSTTQLLGDRICKFHEQQALQDAPITIHGDGKQSRCFCDVRDTVEAVTKLIDAQAFGEVFNIGSTQEVAIEDLAMLVRQRVGSHSRILYAPYERAYGHGYEDMQRRVPSVEKLQGVTGFRPKIALPEIIDRAAAHLRSAMIEVI
jgi:UDP-glucose 4-epimerase